jgi:tetratricopeptide (TPR) repeat protein
MKDQGAAVRRRRLRIPLGLTLGALTLAAFLPVCRNGFVNFDDGDYITANTHVRHGVTADGLRWAWETHEASNWHPLTWVSLQLDYNLYGRGRPWNEGLAWGYHLTNVLLHAGAVVLLFLVLRGMTGAVWRSALVAAVFAVHPLRVESVAWVAERKDVLCAFFGVAALCAYSRYAARPGWLRYLAVAGLFALGLLSKPMLVTLPCVFLLLDCWPLRRLRQDGDPAAGWSWRTVGQLVLEKVPLLALAAYACVQNWQAQQEAHSIESLDVFPLSVRIGNAVFAYVTYIAKTFWPTRLAVLYPHPGGRLSWVVVLAAAALLAAVTAAAWAQSRRRAYLAVGWLWYVGMLVPVIGLTQAGAQAYADRFTYLPHVGLLVMLVWAAADFAANRRFRHLLLPGAVLVLAALVACTWRQLSYWHDSGTLWQRALDVMPANVVAHYNLGVFFGEHGKPAAAAAQYRAALAVDPAYWRAYANLGEVLLRQGQPAEAERYLAAAVRADPGSASARNNLGLAQVHEGKAVEGAEQLAAAVRTEPDSAEAHGNLGDALLNQGRLEEAVEEYTAAARLRPGWALVQANMGAALFRLGRADAAREHYAEAARLAPDDAGVRWNLAAVLEQQGRLADAEEQYAAVVRLEPAHVGAHRRLGVVLAQLNRLDEAAQQFTAALALNPADRDADEALRWVRAALRRAAAAAGSHQEGSR